MLKFPFGMGACLLLIVIAGMATALFPLGLQNVVVVAVAASTTPSRLAHPNCPDKCGNITVPYPFGLGVNCYYPHSPYDEYYKLSCNSATNPPSLILGSDIEVLNITLDGELWLQRYVSYACYYSDEPRYANFTHPMRIKLFPLSTTRNSLLAIGCDTYVWFDGTLTTNETAEFHSGCMTLCNKREDVSTLCSGVGCCTASIPSGVASMNITAKSFNNHSYVLGFNPCSVAFLVENHAVPSPLDILKQTESYFKNLKFPVVHNWSIVPDENVTGNICKGNSTFLPLKEDGGYRCHCKPGFDGNPYLDDCQDIDECVEGTPNCGENSKCVNTVGGYTCPCPRGYSRTRRNGTSNSDPCVRHKGSIATTIILCVGGGMIFTLIVAFWFHWLDGQRQQIKNRESFFRQNGGHILHAKLSRRDIVMANTAKMFTVKEIKKATDNYSANSIIGRGGFGMVYKGILPNNQVVAIKKSLKVNSTQVEQFINEVIALSQINNKNVVKLLGCCLETEVPLLVYEYIRNGTLHDHLHDEQKVRLLTWDVRLRIASEVAEVLAYLHTTITIPIIHRDIKSMNILLDEKYIAKVSDFGASKLVPADQDQLTTIVQGTCGYLDPEYMQTGELTEKSDVYSFGVVLVELLTGQKAISYDKPEEERCLPFYFLRKLKEDCLLKILDDNIVSEGAIEQLKEVANLARNCIKVRGEDRPTMKQVARELEDITGIGSHPWSNDGGGLLLQEESEYVLGETLANNKGYNNNTMSDSSSSQSGVVQLVPRNDGR